MREESRDRPEIDHAATVVLARRPAIPVERVLAFPATMVGEDRHAKRILSVARATIGAVAAGLLGISAIGKGIITRCIVRPPG